MRKTLTVLVVLCFLMVCVNARSYARWSLDIETGPVWSGYNDVRIPGDTGTRFSLSRDLDVRSRAFVRGRLSWDFSQRHHLSALVAPLTLRASGQVGKVLTFFEEDFPAYTPLAATYTFNSYRLTYRYAFVDDSEWKFGLGFTAKIREAAIRVEGGGKSSEKTNVGFVPLLNLHLERRFPRRVSLLVDADALAAPQGRAEDVFVGAHVGIAEAFSLKGGYRFVEGGADNDEVYNFAFIHYGVVGLVYEF